MKKKITLFLILCCTINCIAQNISVNQVDSYKLFTETLKNSKDLKYQDILDDYDRYIETHPNDVQVQLYRCKFIGSAYYDEYEDYNLKYEETGECINTLYENFPRHPKVLLYKLDNTYSEERGDLITEVIDIYLDDKNAWTYGQIGEVFEIASEYYTEDDDYKAISYAKKAERFSDSLDLSVLLTKAHLRLGNREEAKENLMASLFYNDHYAWTLQQKGELLIEFGETEEALKMFERVKEKDSTFKNNESLYKIFVKNKAYELARTYLVKDTIAEWNKIVSIQKLLTHDISYSEVDTALVSYRRMQDLSYYDDFFGIKRIKIFFKSPFRMWTFNELTHVLLLVVLLVVVFLFPYVWVLPVYSARKLFKIKSPTTENRIPVDWSLKHFWLISFAYLMSQIVLILVLYYQEYMNSFFDIVYIYSDEGFVEPQLLTANKILVYSALLFVLTLLFLNKKRLKFIVHSDIRYLRIAVLSIMFLIFNGIILKTLGSFMDLSEATTYMQTLSMKFEMKALISEYGFGISVLAVAMVVPFYEEIIFRGIILSSSEKHLGFKWANVLQACLFAVVHFNLKLFIFYFIFGLVTGYAVKRTNGLLTGIVFHAVNNFFVLLTLYMLTRLVPDFY